MLSVLLSILLLLGLGRRDDDDEDDDEREQYERMEQDEREHDERSRKRSRILRLASIVPAVLAVILFLLTQDMTLPMALFDIWTPTFAILALICVVLTLVILARRDERRERQ